MAGKGSTILPTCPITGPGSRSATLHFVIGARDLPMRDRGLAGSSVQDPYVRWSVKDSVNNELVKAGETKFKQNNPNPDWEDQVFSFEWRQRAGQIWRFEVLDKDTLNKDDIVGYVDVDVDSYVLQKNQELYVKLSDASQGAILLKRVTPISFRLSAQNIPRLDVFKGLSDPYVACYYSKGKDGSLTQFAKTKTIKNVEEAEWEEPVVFGMCQPGTNQYLTFKVLDDDKLPKDDTIGNVSVEVDQIIKSKVATVLRLADDGKNQATLSITPIV